MTPEAFAQIVNDFLDDAYDHADKLERSVKLLRETMNDIDLLEEAHRAVHTIKGSSAMLAIRAPEEVMADRLEVVRMAAAAAEERFEAAQEGRNPLNPASLDLLEQLPDLVREMLCLEKEPDRGLSVVRSEIIDFQAAVERDTEQVMDIPSSAPEYRDVSTDDLLTLFEVAHPALKIDERDESIEDEEGDVVLNALSQVFGVDEDTDEPGSGTGSDAVTTDDAVEKSGAEQQDTVRESTEPEQSDEPAGAEAVPEKKDPLRKNKKVLATLLGLKAREESAPHEKPAEEEPEAAPEPVAAAPVASEPIAEEPATEEPVGSEPSDEDQIDALSGFDELSDEEEPEAAPEPVAAAPVASEPIAEEPATEEPVGSEPSDEDHLDALSGFDELSDEEEPEAAPEPVAAAPVALEPIAEEPVGSEPSDEDQIDALSGFDELSDEEEPEAATEPVAATPVASEPIAEEPVGSEPSDEDHLDALSGFDELSDEEEPEAATEPVAATPVASEPIAEEPVGSEPSDEDHLDALSGFDELSDEEEPEAAPEPVAAAPVASEPIAEEPATEEPSDEDHLDALSGFDELSDEEEPEAATEPVAAAPVASEPIAEEPVGSEPSDEDHLDALSGFDELSDEEEPEAAPEPVAAAPVEEEDEEEGDDDPAMREIFLMESEEVIGVLRASLETLSSTPDDQNAISELRRGAHTLKGSAAMLGYERVREMGLIFENLGDVLLEHGRLQPEDADLYQRGIAWFEQAAERIGESGKSGRAPGDLRQEVEARTAAYGGGEQESETIASLTEAAESADATPAPAVDRTLEDELSGPSAEDELAMLEGVAEEPEEPGDDLAMLESVAAEEPEEEDTPEVLPDDPMRDIFLEEAEHLLEQLDHDLIILEQNPEDASVVNNILRVAHTLKGSAGTVGFDRSQAVAHRMESLLQLARDENVVLNADAIDVLLSALDYITGLTEEIRSTGREKRDESPIVAQLEATLRQLKGEEPEEEAADVGLDTVSGLPTKDGVEADPMRDIFVQEATELLDVLGRDLVSLEESTEDPDVVNRVLRAAHTLKGSAAMLEFSRVRDLAHAMEDGLQVIRDLHATIGSSTVDALLESTDVLGRLVESVARTGRESDEDVSGHVTHLRELAERLKANPEAEAEDEHTVLMVEERSEASEAEPVDEGLRETFIEESRELLTSLVRSVTALEVDGSSTQAKQEFLKAIVAMSGSAAAFHFVNIASLTSNMDSVVQKALEDNTPVPADVVELLNDCLEALTGLFETLHREGRDSAPDVKPLVRRLGRIVPEKLKTQVAEAASAEKKSAEEARQEDQRSRSRIIEVDLSRLNRLMNLAAELVISRTRLSTELVRLSSIVGELSDQGSSLSGMQQRLSSLSPLALSKAGGGEEIQTSGSDEGVLNDFSGAEFDRFSDIDVISRDLRDSSSIISDLSGDFGGLAGNFDQNITRISAIAKELHDEILRVRMVRMERTYTRIPRIVRDAARSEKKQVKLVLEGADTEIDKNILEALNTPIMHMLRNNVSHGIEPPDERSAKGKPPAGTITVRAAQEGNQIVLDIRDDGRGIDPVRIRSSAVEKNMMTPQQIASLSDTEVIDLIFEPGFSSAKEITDISGRGVGLDVVRSVVTRLNGTVNIETEMGVGTTFRLTLPLTLAIGQALLVQVGDRYFAFPLTSVHNIAEIIADDITYINDQAYIYRDEQPIPLVILAEVLGVEQTESPNGHARPTVTVREGERQMALVVDRILGREDIVIKTLGEHLKRVPGISGATILGDGSVVMILNVPYFLSAKTMVARRTASGLPVPGKEPEKVEKAAEAAKPADAPEEPGKEESPSGRAKGARRILVVDDSISIRKYVSGVLERNGHSVLTANDGLDAWEKMQDEEFALVISDLEMPRMHGYELIAEIKKFDRTRNTPVVFLTARAGDKHRRMGMELGASAFLNKPFKEPELMEILGTLLEQS